MVFGFQRIVSSQSTTYDVDLQFGWSITAFCIVKSFNEDSKLPTPFRLEINQIRLLIQLTIKTE